MLKFSCQRAVILSPPLAGLTLRVAVALAAARFQQGKPTLREPKAPPEVLELARSGQVLEPGWGKSKRKLATVGACRMEAARLYHMAADGKILPEDLSRGVWALVQIAKLVEGAELESRIAQLEAMLEQKASR